MVSGDGRGIDDDASNRLRSPAHGFCDDDATRRLLRTRPPRAALCWVETHAGGRVVSMRALRGGMSSAVHVVTVEHPGGQRCRVVLRRYVGREVNDEEPDVAEREARTLRFVEQLEVTTPRLLAVGPTGDDAGVPALLMTRLSGRVDWWPKNLECWLRRLAALLPQIHAVGLPASGGIRPYCPYPPSTYQPPPWARWPGMWERALEIFHGPAPDLGRAFIQRDFHPGNVLWSGGDVSGVVDWQAASIGPAAVDVGHRRANLLGFNRNVAERFTRLWEQASGLTYHPWIDVVTVVDFLDDLHNEWGSERLLVEEVLAAAVAELTGGA